MQILQIPIFATADHAKKLFLAANQKLPIGEIGALNELYTRIMRLTEKTVASGKGIKDGYAPKQGEGYNAFGTVKLIVSGGKIFSAGTITSGAKAYSFNELVDRALLQINEHRSYFGAFFGRLEHNVANLSALTENLSGALSRVQDTDYGAETSALTRVQILQQAATAMLAQANAMPNVVLGLLKSQ